jgi:hypothetical protein
VGWGSTRSLDQHLMKTEHCDHQRGQTNPRPNLPPPRRGLGRFQLTADHGSPLRSLNLDFESPATGFRKFELGRLQELVGRRLRCRGIFQGMSPGFGHADGHLNLRHGISRRGILNQHA